MVGALSHTGHCHRTGLAMPSSTALILVSVSDYWDLVKGVLMHRRRDLTNYILTGYDNERQLQRSE